MRDEDCEQIAGVAIYSFLLFTPPIYQDVTVALAATIFMVILVTLTTIAADQNISAFRKYSHYTPLNA